MARSVPINNSEHRDLRVITRRGAEYGDAVNQVLVFPTEFGELQREYPIFFVRNAEGAFQAVSLLGFEKGENLYLDGQTWRANYLPAIQQRGPFVIGLPPKGAEAQSEPTINIDLEDARVSTSEGEPIFLQHGGNAPYLQRIAHALRIIHQGVDIAPAMFAAFESAGLIAPMAMEVKLSEQQSYNFANYYTIAGDRLAALDGAQLERLNKAGFLYAAFMVLTSMNNVSRLIEMKNRKRAAAA